ncbi:conserved hypothetical protein [Treponema phagedenis]|uniref:Uncharacterized protein n=1 Tax=Treponema phagedenis TaxID=162 RepID=A0A0B7GUK7_TREPH|nr:conserved hypothetical protein [Treponema phagedenis]
MSVLKSKRKKLIVQHYTRIYNAEHALGGQEDDSAFFKNAKPDPLCALKRAQRQQSP